MKQSTFSAVMANSIKNLWQGYTKGIRFVAVLMVLLTMGIGQAWGADTWTLITDASTLKAGDELVIVSSNGFVAGNISSSVMASVSVTISNNTIEELPNTAVPLTLGGSSGAWTFANSEGKLLGATAVKKVAWGSGTTTWSISIDSDNNATIQNGTSSYGRFLYNVGSPRFTTYTSDTNASMLLPQLYRKTASDTKVTLSKGTVTNGSISMDESEVTTTSAAQSVTVTCTPNTGYYTKSVSATKPATGNTPTYGGSGNSRTVTYSKGSNGSSTITATFTPAWQLRGTFNNWGATHPLTSFSGNIATVTVDLQAMTEYTFKFVNVSGSSEQWYGNTGAIITDISNWEFSTSIGDNARLYTGPAGTYTFKFNVSTKALQVIYPTVTHPAEGYAYFQKQDSWNGFKVYNYTSDENRLSDWPGSPSVTNTTTICGKTYYYTALATQFQKVIFRDNGSNQWKEINVSGYSGKYCGDDYNATPQTWKTFNKYSITFNSNGGSGTMSTISGICPGDNQTLPANTFTRTGYTFDGWATSANGNKAYNDKATISNINSNITLYARWKANIYTITSNLTNCSSSPEIPTSYTYTGSAANLTYIITPESGYRLPDAITVSGCTYTWNKTTGQLKLTGTISGNVTITIEAVKVYDITWKVNKQTYTTGGPTTSVDEGSTYKNLILPTPPADNTLYECYPGKKFVGWSTTNIGSTESDKPSILFKTAAEAPNTAITENTTLYAVFATETGGGTTTTSESTTLDFSAQGYENQAIITSLTIGDITAAFSKGSNSNAPKYYTSGTAVRVYGGGYFTVTASTGKITEVIITTSSGEDSNTITADCGTYTTNTKTWTGSASSVTFTVGGSSGHRRIKSLAVTYSKTTDAAPTYSNYVTECCTLNNINLDNSGTTTGGTFSAKAPKACKGEDITLTATAADCYEFVSWTIKKTSDSSDVTNSVLNGNTLTMPDYAVTVYATFKSLSVTEITLSMTGGHKNLDVGETNQLLVDYTPTDATCDNAIVSWTSSNDNVMSVTSDGLVKALRAGNATITATTEGGVTATYTITVNNPACEAWFIHYWNASTGGDECFYKVKPDDPNDHEWRTNNFSLPSISDEDKFIVNNTPEDSYKTDQVFRTGIGFADIQRGGQNCGTNPYPGQDAYGQLSIYDDSNTPNRYIAFYPAQYLVTYGKEGAAPWEVLPLNNTTGYEYETEPFMVPNGYKTDDTYKYYVGITDKNGNIKYVGYEFGGVEYKKSSVDPMNTVNGLSADDMAGKWGTWHIYSNSCANNWYCEFIHYYRVDFNLNGGEGYFAPRYGKATTPYVEFTTTDIGAPTRMGYTFLGWKDQYNKIYAPTDAIVTINNDFTLTALWKENYASDNCRWEEVTIDDIEYGDEVVVTMGTNTTVYALHNTEIIINSPKAKDFSVIGNYLEDYNYSDYSWYIIKTNDGYQLQSCADNSKYLYGVSSYITISNTPTTFSIFKNTENGNECFRYIANSVVYYLGHGTEDSETAWKRFKSTDHLATNTLKFYKKVCLPEGQYRVTWDANGGAWSDGTITKEEIYTEGAAINLPEEPELDGYKFDSWEPAPTTMPAENTTFKAKWAKLHTITWMVGGSELTTGSQTTSVENGKKITAIPANPNDNTLNSCGANKFMGWSTKSSGSTPEDADYYNDLFTTVAESPEITKPTTFYAVFATAEETTGGTVDATLSFANTQNRVSHSNSKHVWAQNDITFTNNKASSTSDVNEAYNPIRCYKNSSITITHTSNEITKIVFDCNGTDKTSHISDLIPPLENSGTGTVTESEDIITITFNKSQESFTLNLSSGQVRLDGITVTAGGGTITTYSNYVTNCCATPVPTNGSYTSPSGTSVTLTWDGESTRYHITGNGLDDYTDDESYTVTGLTECNEYTFYVSAYPEDGCESEAITITAQPYGGAKTVNYDYNGGSGPFASFTTSCDDDKREIILPVATRPGYTFEGWYDSEENKVGDAGATYDPATSPITLYAHWTETIYKLTHSGSNYTNTENKISIKSSDTPFALHYTCTGDYGLPATISITGGGKSWTVNTDYTWEVAADKQSATLVIKETVISADVTITINVATRYTVTFVHNDKGVFSGSETIEVLSSENTITLPTVTDVSCGFYDTFEGWIVANEDYTESTSKPAGTIYKGGASYTVIDDCVLRALYSKCEGDNKEVYVKVIENLDDWSGTYLIVNETNNVVMDGSKTTETGLIAQNNCQDITINNNQIESNNQNDTYTFTIAPHTTTSGKYSIKSYSGYYIGSSSASNTINATTTESTYSNSITITDGILTIGCGKYKDSDASKEYRLMYMHSGSGAPVFKYYPNTQGQVCLYKKGTLCTKYYSTNPSCEKPVGVHIVYNANAVDASMSCSTQDRTYKVENEVNKYPQLASQLQFCTNATREGYTLVGWNTQANGQGTTYNINQNYYNLPVSGELDGDKWITLNLYAMWKPCIKFNLGNAIGGTGVPDAVVENGGCVLPTPTAEQLGTIPCGYEFYAWSETSVNATQTKPALFMPGDTYTGSALTLYAVYRWCEGNTGSDTYYFTFIVDGQTYCITQKHSNYARFVVEEATSGLIFGVENDYLYYLDENGVKNYVYYEGSSTTVITTTTYPNSEQCKTTFVDAGDGTTIVEPAINNGNRTLQFTGTGNISDYYDRAYYTTGGTNPTLVEVQSSTCTYATNPTCYTNTNLHFVTNGGTLNYPTDYNETNYQELAIGDDILLPTATFAGEWTFEGWKRGSQLESQTIKPYDPSFYPVTPNSTLFEVDELGDIYFYAVYSKTNDDKQFDPVNGGTYKLFAIGADGTKTYMPIWTGSRGTPSGVTTCAESGDYTITPGAGTHAGQYQITCGEYTLGVVSGNTDLNEVEGTWWNIEPSTSGKGTWRITVVGSTDDRALICSFSTAKSFGNYAISNLNNSSQTIYRDMEIGECIYTEYTSTPENIPYITITGAPVKITSTNGERVYAPTTLHIEAHNFTGERTIHLSATNGFGVDPVQVRTNGQGAYSGDVKVYYEPTTDGDGQIFTTSVLTASQTGGTNDEKISQTFTAIQGRNMPANFVIAAKWDGHWYALPANCTTSDSSTEGLLIEVDDVDNPTKAKSAPASAKYGIREVIPSRQTNNGKAIVFTERFAEGDKQFALYNGSNANIQVNAQYTNYAQTNPDPYEWIPSTSDFKDYTLTNASTGRNLGLTSGTFGAYTAASNQVRLLPATFYYEPATTQVLKWKANSVIVMYTGPEATATTQIGNNAASDKQTLADQKITHGIYELTTKQALTSNAGGALKLNFGENTRVELEIPLIISGEVTASANAHDVVILENSKLTAATTKYSYKDVYVYGGAKLAIPDGTELGVNNIILRAGGVATNGEGQEATYQYIYPQVELKGTLTSSVQNIRYEYVTDNDHWYHLVLPFDGSLTSIHYPYEYYGDQVKLDNKGSWIIKRYDGATRATGDYDAWKDIEKDEPKATTVTAGKGYIYWGAPKKITANDVYDRPTWGIQRITMSVSAPAAKTAENEDKTLTGLSSHKDVPNKSGAVNDQGWNLIGNPYMVNLTGLNSESLKPGKLVEVEDAAGNWTGQWKDNEDGFRYVTIPSDHFDTYTAQRMTAFTEANPMIAGRAFFIQLEDDDAGVTFSAANRASLMPALRAANDKPVDIETGIVLSNETLQDEVNFWIKAGKTNDYEYNADYPKTPNTNNFNIYGVHTNGHLSWVATGPEYAAESMPIGYQVPAAGTYMLSVSEEYYSDEVDALLVTDHEMSPEVTTDLMITSYEFSVNQAETNNKRFTVAIKLKNGDNNGATGLDNLGIGNEHLMKFIYQDKIYILHHGVIYDATGKRVITINK